MTIQVRKEAHLKGHKASIFTVAKGQNAQSMISGSGDGWVVHWHLDDPEIGKLIAKVDGNIWALLYLAEKDWILAGNMHGGLHWVDLNNPENTKNIAHHKNGVFDIKMINGAIYSLGGDGMLTKWNVEERRAVESFHLANQNLRNLAYCSIRNEIAIGASDEHIYILDAKDMTLKRSFKAHDKSAFCLHYSPDGQHLFSGGRDAHLKVWDTEHQFELVSSQPAHMYTINSIEFHPKGHLLATGSRDKTVKIWDSSTLKLLKVLDTVRDGGDINSVNKLHWPDYKNYLISASDDRSLIVWSVE